MTGLLARMCPFLGLMAVLGLISVRDTGKQVIAHRPIAVQRAVPSVTQYVMRPGRVLSQPSQAGIIPIPTTWDAVMMPIPTDIDAKIVLLKTKPGEAAVAWR